MVNVRDVDLWNVLNILVLYMFPSFYISLDPASHNNIRHILLAFCEHLNDIGEWVQV